jgi:hypothetical protein
MPKLNDIYTIIVPAQNANISAHTYTEIYGGSAGCSITVNGIPLSIGPSSNVSIWIKSVSGGNGCFLLGEKQDVIQGSTLLG